MKITMIFLLILILTFGAFGQKRKVAPKPKRAIILRPVDESALERANRRANTRKAATLPAEYSSVFDIKKFMRFDILADSSDPVKSVEAIKKVLFVERSIHSVGDTEDPQFYIKYVEGADKTSMEVYYFNYGKRIVVWAEERSTAGAETELIEEFLKVLRRNKKLDALGDAE
jgi:hypothetical protein